MGYPWGYVIDERANRTPTQSRSPRLIIQENAHRTLADCLQVFMDVTDSVEPISSDGDFHSDQAEESPTNIPSPTITFLDLETTFAYFRQLFWNRHHNSNYQRSGDFEHHTHIGRKIIHIRSLGPTVKDLNTLKYKWCVTSPEAGHQRCLIKASKTGV